METEEAKEVSLMEALMNMCSSLFLYFCPSHFFLISVSHSFQALAPLKLEDKDTILFPLNNNPDYSAVAGGSHWRSLSFLSLSFLSFLPFLPFPFPPFNTFFFFKQKISLLVFSRNEGQFYHFDSSRGMNQRVAQLYDFFCSFIFLPISFS